MPLKAFYFSESILQIFCTSCLMSVSHLSLTNHLSQLFLTLHDQVNLGGLGLMLCLNRASIGTLIIDIHLLDSEAVFQRMAFLQLNPRVQRPLVMTSKNDPRTVQPGHLRVLVFYNAPARAE